VIGRDNLPEAFGHVVGKGLARRVDSELGVDRIGPEAYLAFRAGEDRPVDVDRDCQRRPGQGLAEELPQGLRHFGRSDVAVPGPVRDPPFRDRPAKLIEQVS
jgi:hypothetical protein